VYAPVVPPVAFIYTGYKAPLDLDYNNTPTTGKKGTATVTNVLGLVSFGDGSAKAAAENAGITKIQCADYEFTNVLWLFSVYTTVVYGE
jgi:hypothetical protein